MTRTKLPELILRCSLLALAPAVVAHGADDAPSAPASGTSLQAIVMDVQGKARWRPSSEAEWRDAKVNDIVDPGTEIRTGLKGRLTLRVGKNATVLVDAGTEFHIPDIVQEGETLRTLATVKSGRVDFKVDKVGFSNDFKVVTPATTLSVRGTGFSLATGPLQGVEVSGVRTNMINAIEVKYVASNATYFMSGAAQTSSDRQDPVQNAWVSTVGPPAVAGMLADKGQLAQQVAQGQAGNAPTNSQMAQQIAAAQANGQGGNALIIAAQDANASDAMRQLAVDVTGNSGAVTPPSDKGGATRSPGQRLLDGELAYVESERANANAQIAQLAAAADGLLGSVATPADSEFANSFEAAYFRPDSETFPEFQRIREEVSERIANASSEDALQTLHAVADHPTYEIRDGLTLDLTSEVASTGAWAASLPRDGQGRLKLGGGSGEDVFLTAHRDADHSTQLEERDADGQRTAAPNAVRWLENAQGWSAADRSDASDWAAEVAEASTSQSGWGRALHALDRLDNAARLWGIDSRGPDGERSPTMVAVMVNEAVQLSWNGVVSSALGNDVGSEIAARHGEVSGGIARMVEVLDRNDMTSTQAGLIGYIAAYRAAAGAEGTPEAQRSLEAFLAIVEPIQQDLDDALSAAYASVQSANEARSVSYRVFHLAAANAILQQQFRQAGEIASRCQNATFGVNGIVPNSAAIQSSLADAARSAIASGAIRPDIVIARDGGRP